jgi:hypothetical protein
VALRSAIVPVPGASRAGTLVLREAEEEEAVVGSTSDTENDLLARVTAGSVLATSSTWACEADCARQCGAFRPGTGGDTS